MNTKHKNNGQRAAHNPQRRLFAMGVGAGDQAPRLRPRLSKLPGQSPNGPMLKVNDPITVLEVL